MEDIWKVEEDSGKVCDLKEVYERYIIRKDIPRFREFF